MILLINTIIHHGTIRMKLIYVKFDFYAECSVDFDAKNAKFKKEDHVRISKCKNFLAKGYAPNWSEEVCVINKVKNTVL